MGAGRLGSAVSDAGPLIHLTEVGCLSLLTIFEALHIPNAVWQETVEQGRIQQADVSGLGNVQRHTLSGGEVTAFAQAHGLEKLHAGESECLYLCQRVGVSTLLTDDLTVREAAKRLNVTTGGFLGRCRQGIPTGTHLAI